MSVLARCDQTRLYVSADAGVTWTAWNGGAAAAGGLTDAQLRATPVPVSGTVAATQSGAPWSDNITQLAGTAVAVNSGVKDAGTLRVILATDQPQLTNKLLVTPDSVALPANQSVNVNQFGGSAVVTGVGASGAGIPRVTSSAEDTTGTLATITGTTTLAIALAGKNGASAEIQAGTLVATMSFQSSFDGGVTYSTGFAVVAGVQSITSTAFTNPNPRTTVDWILSEGVTHVRVNVTAWTSGSAVVRLNATNIVSPVAVGALSAGLNGSAVPFFSTILGGRAATTLPTATTNGMAVAGFYDSTGRQITRPWNSWHINNVPVVATAATISQAAAGAGVKNVCTAITVSISSTAAPTAGAVQFVLRDGATGAGTILWTVKLSIPAVAGNAQCLTIPGVWFEGTANTAMTLETVAAPAAGTFATVSMSGTLTT